VKLATLVLIGSVCAAQAQTIPLVNNKTGEKIGTVTIDRQRSIAYLRDIDEKLIHVMKVEKDGTRIVYDPDGNVVAKLPPIK
jgi:hypothetical protein